MFNLTPMVKNILIINIGIYALQAIFNFNLAGLLGVHYIFSDDFFIFQYVTYMWLHSTNGMMHLFGNMFAVLIFGPMLERVWGSKKFLTFYLITGIGAGVLYGLVDTIEKRGLDSELEAFISNPNPEDFYIYTHNYIPGEYYTVELSDFADEYYENADDISYTSQAISVVNQIYTDLTSSSMVGASGAVFGILMAFAMLFPNTELLLFMIVPIKAKYLVFFYGAYELYSEINRSGTDKVY